MPLEGRFELELNNLIWALAALPTHLRDEAGKIVIRAAEGAKEEIQGAYPPSAASLAAAMEVRVADVARFGVAADVINHHPLARMYDLGTAARHTSLGRNRGVMPPAFVFEPRYRRWRRAMYDRLKQLVEDQGFVVSGDEPDDAGFP